MIRSLGLGLVCLLAVAGLLTGCNQQSDAPASPPGYFHTSFQTECQFIVEAIVTDLAEEIVYATSHRLPDPKHFYVTVTETPGSPVDAPVYNLTIRLERKKPELKFQLAVTNAIWSPETYETLAAQLANKAGLHASQLDPGNEAHLAPKLTDAAPDTIAKEDLALSAALEKDFRNPELHEQAALLLGAFMLRDNSGDFYEIRSSLSRLTAHLTLARLLRGYADYGPDAQLAEATLLTLVGDTGPAAARLDALGTNNPTMAPFVRALRAYATGDYRLLDKAKRRSPLESVAWFAAMSGYAGAVAAWEKLDEDQKQTIDVVRIANERGSSVGMGHELLRATLPLEGQETSNIYELYWHKSLEKDALVAALNELPQRCLGTNTAGQLQVHVLGWGQWAYFLQRHLCHALQHNYAFLAWKLGVPEDAQQFAAACDQQYDGLRFYPFVRRFNCHDEASYHRAVDDGYKVTVATPHLVPAACWNALDYNPRFAALYRPNPNPHINEWHSHNPPPGTVYDLDPRLNHPSLVQRPDFVARLETLHALAPYDCRVSNWLLAKKHNNQATYPQAMELFGPILEYSRTAARVVAGTVYDRPQKYEELMLKAAALDLTAYYDLSTYAQNHNQEAKAAEYLEKACEADPDAVRVSNHAEWRVRYFLSKGQTNQAEAIADAAAEVYSYAGLRAKALFLEWTTNYEGAFEWYGKIEERYEDSFPLLNFCIGYKAQSGDTRFDAEVEKRTRKLFPKGIEKVSAGDIHGAPQDGVLIQEQNALLKAAGLKAGDIIVAAYGIRVRNMRQYSYVRDSQRVPELQLLVWQDGTYREVKASPPNHRFGVQFDDYVPPQPGRQ